MWEYIVVGILVAGAVFGVVRRLVKGATTGACGSCKCGETDAKSPCQIDSASDPFATAPEPPEGTWPNAKKKDEHRA